MKLMVAVFGLCLATFAPAFAGTSTDPQPQALSINVHGDGAQATRLPVYDPAIPIAVTVTNGGAHRLDGVTIVASGPSGESIHVPLARTTGDAFTGWLRLQDQGAWRLRLTSRTGSISIATTPVTLEIQAPPPSNAWQVGLAVGLGIFIVVGGSGFFILRRTVGASSGALQRAA